ncbi:hypothetical protein M885DRAFT_529294 [Pelagophyceae sp. CCMP2097]|nr:hypothetical protein M885DRAFT_529294 [Pelagophyceae sp. CCMP2097]
MAIKAVVCACVIGGTAALQLQPPPRAAEPPRKIEQQLGHQAAAGVVALSLAFSAPSASFSADATTTAGFEDFAASGGVMEAKPACFFDECGEESKACFTNPSCLKGITCLGQCRGEQLCATRCFARFGSEKLNSWLACTLEEKKCVTTGTEQDTSTFYADPPPRLETFKPAELEGRWIKVIGYSQKYDCFPCQANTFTADAKGELRNDIEFRVPKPGAAGGYWQNRFDEKMVDERGPQGKASLTVEGKMYGLTFHEQWYVLARGAAAAAPYEFVAYKGDTQQGPYDGAFLLMKYPQQYDMSAPLRAEIDAVARKNGLAPEGACRIDNACPAAGVEVAGASSADKGKEKLTWRDVFELTEWIRPGTIKKAADFDPNAM